MPVVFASSLVAWGLHFAEISPLFTLIGFRIYIPFLPLLYIIFLRFRADEAFRFKPFPWKTALSIIAGNLLIAGAGWYSGMLKFRLPEFHFELAASSLVDFPVYFIWTSPFFALIWFGLYIRPASVWFRVTSSLMLLLIFSPQIYTEASGIKNVVSAIPLAAFVAAVLGIGAFSKSMLHFALLAFTAAWCVLLIYGTEHKLLLNTFLAYRYENWDGFFTAKDNMIPYFRAGGVLFALLVSALIYKKVS